MFFEFLTCSKPVVFTVYTGVHENFFGVHENFSVHETCFGVHEFLVREKIKLNLHFKSFYI